ncbi:DUF4177 domain-containing protein [Allgaiera indica]|nr:DUF4177 domain-containing protein [Allgaiera indica]SDW38619.1 protein of unknown function [Allgaiera indica]
MSAPSRFEYKVVPAPKRAEKVRGAKYTEDRFAHALAGLINKLSREGWEYVRAETLPCEERSGLRGRTTTFQNMLIFRRQTEAETEAEIPAVAAAAPAEPALHRDPVRAQRNEGPRLVTLRGDEGGMAPAVGSAKGEQPAK